MVDASLEGCDVLKRRAKGVLELGWAALQAGWTGKREHLPHWAEYPDALVERIGFRAGGGLDWRLSMLRTPRARPAPWKIVVVTGAPSWAEYWSSSLAATGPDREMAVVDRPGFGFSEPEGCVPELAVQARALSPLLDSTPGQRLLLVGQSYGASIATLMAAEQPDKVDALVLLSGLFGEMGPTAAWLVDMGRRVQGVIPRDLRNAITEVRAQAPQLPVVRQALSRLTLPIHIVHGEDDDFAPIATAQALAEDLRGHGNVRFTLVPHGNHFLNDGPPEMLLSHLEAAIAAAPTLPAPAPSLWRRLRAAFAAPVLSRSKRIEGPTSV